MNGEIEEVACKPESLLSAKTKQVLIETIDREFEKALNEGDNVSAMEFQRAKKLINDGCWSVRKDNPYLYFMEGCLKGKGGSLKETHEAMQQCSLEWMKMDEAEKEKYRAKAKGLAIYDFL